MRRLAPRPLAMALSDVTGHVEPPTLLARVQSAWAPAVGDVLAAETEPAGERGGVVTVHCSSSLWASELELMAADLVAALKAEMGSKDATSPVSGLRFVTAP